MGGRQSTQRKPTHAQGEHANSMQEDPRPGVEPRSFLLQGNSATHCSSVQPGLIRKLSELTGGWMEQNMYKTVLEENLLEAAKDLKLEIHP
ncbi:hypothetical protein ATANTOWER_014862 [Ataeniobius toweri]|uniref:Uncharacterized protein n=1 Tax=Ataeniobius toweri TaxID=208326 RepID=A0ABU7ARL6_9TELE|nr:hypothetical protein [Ataeniobius toweri]